MNFIMEEELKIGDTEIRYRLRRSGRARRLRIDVRLGASVILTVPRGIGENSAVKFLEDKAEWVISKLKYFERFKNCPAPDNTRENYLKYKAKAFFLAKKKIEYYNGIYNFSFSKISIGNAKTRWGSCSKKGNLNFSYKIALLPEKLADYIIVHELCHLKEFNHSGNFWNLVAKSVPDHTRARKELKSASLVFL